jgi:hypothetical protein
MAADFGIFKKHPWAISRILVDWSGYLADLGTTVSISTWVVASGTVTLSGDTIQNGVASVLITGGTDNTKHYVENRVTFADGSSSVFTVVVDVSDRVPA